MSAGSWSGGTTRRSTLPPASSCQDDARRLIGDLDHVPEILPPCWIEGRILVAQDQAIRARLAGDYQVPAIRPVAEAHVA